MGNRGCSVRPEDAEGLCVCSGKCPACTRSQSGASEVPVQARGRGAEPMRVPVKKHREQEFPALWGDD